MRDRLRLLEVGGADPAWLTFVIAGGGPTGVELAGQIAEFARETLRRDFRRIDTGAARVLLVDLGDRLGRSDVAVIQLRQLYTRGMRALAEGRPLKQWTALTPMATSGLGV